ncbi:glycoside hydrolase family 26 protein [Vibrio quintilis]|uniref:Mannan endo-1,4-beta-mannosidase n=1 Tax=Vibrio quintilis TaxID=1117707 RepID=A0A1M7Z245_9VIBR|nr:glycosyl hydrolase [Vibrio quintilis]SHO58951.1 Mannan endo-1,4-beta-mannosidase precursor [Vibrio quintilis]
MKKKLTILSSVLLCSLSCSALAASLINRNATAETKNLYYNLSKLGRKVMFGHEDSLAYGTQWWGKGRKAALNSDIKLVSGAFPAVFGADLGGIGTGHEKNLDGVKFSDYRYYIQQNFLLGGVNTISWHMYSPVDLHDAWIKKSYVHDLIPGGKHHDRLITFLDSFIHFNQGLKVNQSGKKIWIPVIFRPWHEHNGDWFWWGKGHTSEQDYIALWKFTVDYLNSKGQNNLIYEFSPDRSRLDMNHFEASYLYGYAGDKYVDILGYDNYWDLGHPANQLPAEKQQALFVQGLEKLTDLAAKKDKVSALSEGGQEGVTEAHFWTQRFSAGIFANRKTSRISYALVWRNNNESDGQKGHFFGTYPHQKNADDFRYFYQNPNIVLMDTIPDLYHR